MTQKEIEEKIAALKLTIKKARSKIKALKNTVADDNVPYPIGTKVKATDFKGNVEYGIVVGAKLDIFNNTIPVVHKIKKNGKASKTKELVIWCDTKIEPITE